MAPFLHILEHSHIPFYFYNTQILYNLEWIFFIIVYSQNTWIRNCIRCSRVTRCSRTWSRISCATRTTWRCATRWTHSPGLSLKRPSCLGEDDFRHGDSRVASIRESTAAGGSEIASGILKISENFRFDCSKY